MANKVDVSDHTQEWLSALAPAAEGQAKAKCPVDTGRLRNSITQAQPDSSVRSSDR